MRFVTTLLPIITLAVRVAAAPPAVPSSCDIELERIDITHPEAIYDPTRSPPYVHPSQTSANAPVQPIDVEAQQEPCSACLDKAKAALAKVWNCPKHLGQAANRHCGSILAVCVVIIVIGGAIGGGVYYGVKSHLHKCHTGPSLPDLKKCLEVRCGPEDCGTASHMTTKNPLSALDGGHVKRDVARRTYRSRLQLDQ